MKKIKKFIWIIIILLLLVLGYIIYQEKTKVEFIPLSEYNNHYSSEAIKED